MEITNQQSQQVVEQNGVNVDAQPQQQEEKTFTYSQSELDQMFETRLARQEKRLNAEFEEKLNALQEAQKLQAMSDEERKEHEFNKRLAELEARENAIKERETAYSQQQYKAEIVNQLQSKGLPTEMADLLVGFDAETVSSKIAVMEQSFASQVNSAVESRVKQSANTPIAHQSGQVDRLYTMQEIQAMSREEVRQNKTQVDKSLEAIARQQGLIHY